MMQCIYKWRRAICFSPLFFLLMVGCQEGKNKKTATDSLATPVLSPEASLQHFQLADHNLSIRLVASEPLIQAPVAIAFDAKGRIWAAEMQGYMPDTAGTDENSSPTEKIVILEDKNQDGVMDHRKVFMDSLVLPRALCFYDDGVLIAEPPKLWFVKINNDTAGAKYVVDSDYAVGGNVEHQPNGLLRGVDNWIYNAKSAKRYRRINGKWIIEHTHFRGQWGISQDNYGRLFYNNNSVNLLRDYFLPGLGANNPDQTHVSGFDENIVRDNRTYPIHPTPGVNRGYRSGVLDDSSRLIHFTAACGPLIYRGNTLGSEYEGNAFVAEPAANIIKRNILSQKDSKVTGKQAYQGKEFLASDDERFRPVNLSTGPDGAMYIVDMYRGIIQDITYLTGYLKKHIVKKHLQTPLNRGRIYKIKPKGKNIPNQLLYGKSTKNLVSFLDNPNSWVRETAQRLLVDGRKKDAEHLLRIKLKTDSFLPGKIHAFWILEGLGKLQNQDVLLFLHSSNIKLQQQAIAEIVSTMNKGNANYWLQTGEKLFVEKNQQLAPYLGFLAAKAMQYIPKKAGSFLWELASEYPNSNYVSDAVISGLYKHEAAFMNRFKNKNSDTSSTFYRHLKMAVTKAKTRQKNQQKRNDQKHLEGKKLFATYCEICHGKDGSGIRSLGAPLDGSQWVQGDKQKIIGIVLHGLTGPIKVGDKVYTQPEVAGEMPGFGQNHEISDEQLAQILSYIRSAWSNNADDVNAKEVKQARHKFRNRKEAFTMKELK